MPNKKGKRSQDGDYADEVSTKKAKKSKQPVNTVKLPGYKTMVVDAVTHLNDPQGSTWKSILNYLQSEVN